MEFQTLESVKIWKQDIDSKVLTSENEIIPCALSQIKLTFLKGEKSKAVEKIDLVR
jgi:hypothetical protein